MFNEFAVVYVGDHCKGCNQLLQGYDSVIVFVEVIESSSNLYVKFIRRQAAEH